MVAGAITGNMSPEATRPFGNIFADAMRPAKLIAARQVMAGRKPKEVPEFRWINTVLGNLKTGLSGCYHEFDFQKYATRYLAAFSYRFNGRFNLRTLHQRLLIAAATTTPQPLRTLRVAAADVRC